MRSLVRPPTIAAGLTRTFSPVIDKCSLRWRSYFSYIGDDQLDDVCIVLENSCELQTIAAYGQRGKAYNAEKRGQTDTYVRGQSYDFELLSDTLGPTQRLALDPSGASMNWFAVKFQPENKDDLTQHLTLYLDIPEYHGKQAMAIRKRVPDIVVFSHDYFCGRILLEIKIEQSVIYIDLPNLNFPTEYRGYNVMTSVLAQTCDRRFVEMGFAAEHNKFVVIKNFPKNGQIQCDDRLKEVYISRYIHERMDAAIEQESDPFLKNCLIYGKKHICFSITCVSDNELCFNILPFYRKISMQEQLCYMSPKMSSLSCSAHYIRCVTCAVFLMHRCGVVHFDLSLCNVAIDENNDAYVIDFGLAEILPRNIINNNENNNENSGNEYLSIVSHMFKGKQQFSSPEMYDSSLHSIDAFKCDAWSIGVLIMYIFVGCEVFHKRQFVNIRHSNFSLENIFRFYSITRNCVIPENFVPLRNVCARLLDRNPNERATIIDLLRVLW